MSSTSGCWLHHRSYNVISCCLSTSWCLVSSGVCYKVICFWLRGICLSHELLQRSSISFVSFLLLHIGSCRLVLTAGKLLALWDRRSNGWDRQLLVVLQWGLSANRVRNPQSRVGALQQPWGVAAL